MNESQYSILPLGAGGLTVDFGTVISTDVNDRVLALDAAIAASPFPGFTECVPAYTSLTVFFSITDVRAAFPESETAFDAAASIVAGHLADLRSQDVRETRLIEVPVDFDASVAPDFDLVASNAGVGRDELIDIFTAREYRVYMLGFLPGFAYMGDVDERIAAPRRTTPRTKVPRGSVGIAGRQTGIYPLESPGGWQIIGRTDLVLFSAHASEPCLFSAGDRVRFFDRNK